MYSIESGRSREDGEGLNLARRAGEGRHHRRVVDQAVVARPVLAASEEVHLRRENRQPSLVRPNGQGESNAPGQR